MANKNRPSFGRPTSKRGLDLNDTPPIVFDTLFEHEPLLNGVISICEPACGVGNGVMAMRARGITVHASDILDRGCPDSRVLDFFAMTRRPRGCDVLLTNPPYGRAMEFIEHALALEFRLVVLLLKLTFLSTDERYERLHKPGHPRRVHVIVERIQDMHDAAHVAAGGKLASQSQNHGWFVIDRSYCGPSVNNPVSINDPTARMPWLRDPTKEAAE